MDKTKQQELEDGMEMSYKRLQELYWAGTISNDEYNKFVRDYKIAGAKLKIDWKNGSKSSRIVGYYNKLSGKLDFKKVKIKQKWDMKLQTIKRKEGNAYFIYLPKELIERKNWQDIKYFTANFNPGARKITLEPKVEMSDEEREFVKARHSFRRLG